MVEDGGHTRACLARDFMTFGLFCLSGPDHHLRPFRRLGTSPIGGSISRKHSPRSAIKKYNVAHATISHYLPQSGCKKLKPRLREIIKRDPERCNRSGMNSGACRSHSPHVHTARDRPHSTKWSRMAPGGASLMCAIFMCVLGRWGAESREK